MTLELDENEILEEDIVEETENSEEGESISGSRDMNAFFGMAMNQPYLTVEEEQALAKRCAKGDEEAIWAMVSAHLRMLKREADRIQRDDLSMGDLVQDLVQEGIVALVEAARKFDPDRGTRFNTYAKTAIRNAMRKCVEEYSDNLMSGNLRCRISAAERTLEKEGLKPDIRLISERTGIPENQIQKVRERMYTVLSWEALITDDESRQSRSDLGEDVNAPKPLEELISSELKRTLEELLDGLQESEAEILRLYFGLGTGVPQSMEEIGRSRGVSRQRVREIKERAIRRLRERGANVGLEEYLR